MNSHLQDSSTSDVRARIALGVDLGGTKCAAGLWGADQHSVSATRRIATQPERGGDALWHDMVQLVQSLLDDARERDIDVHAIGVGVAELVDLRGILRSAAAIPWMERPLARDLQAVTSLPVYVEADVRAAARAEALVGAGSNHEPFLYVTVGTGISCCLVLNGVPYRGARGLTGTFASSGSLYPQSGGDLQTAVALEQFAGGPAIAARYSRQHAGFTGSAVEVIGRAEEGDVAARDIVVTGGLALGAAVAHLIDTLDPALVVLGGGLGCAGGLYFDSVVDAIRSHVWATDHRQIPVRRAHLGPDSGWIGAALCALEL